MADPILTVTAKSKEKAELSMIGSVHEWGRMSTRVIQAKLKELEAEGYTEVFCPMHCYGGEVYEGIGIMGALEASPLFIHIHVIGISASMGSAILQGADKRTASKNARIMVHHASGGAWGGAHHLRRQANQLEAVTKDLAQVYADRIGKSAKWVVANWMKPDEDTWFNGPNAKTVGLLDEVTPSSVKAPAKANMEFEKVAAFYDEQLLTNTHPEEEMKNSEVAEALGLKPDASEADIKAALAKLPKPAGTPPENTPAPAAEAGDDDPVFMAAITVAETKGFMNDENREDLTAKIRKNPAAYIDFASGAPVAKTEPAGDDGKRLSDAIKMLMDGKEQGEKPKAWEDYSNTELMTMEEKEPEKWQKLYDAKFVKK